ncbi:MAG: hypothetical protein R3C19_04245 [Planctomycetaceae bacterium]
MSAAKIAMFASLLLVAASGCSGSRLRELMPGNSRFVSLEDLERSDEAAESRLAATDPAEEEAAGGPFKAARGLFVSREKDQQNPSDDSGDTRLSKLSLGRLLHRPDRNAVEPDPFLDIDNAAARKPRFPEPEVIVQGQPKAKPKAAVKSDVAEKPAARELPAGMEEALAEAFAEFDSLKADAKLAESKAKSTDKSIRSVVSESDIDDDAESFAAFVDRQFDESRARKATNEHADNFDAAMAEFGADLPDLKDLSARTSDAVARAESVKSSKAADAFDEFAGTGTETKDNDFVLDFDDLLADTKPKAAAVDSAGVAHGRSQSQAAPGLADADAAAFPLLATSDDAKNEFDRLVSDARETGNHQLNRRDAFNLFADAAARHGFSTDGQNHAADAWEPADAAAFNWQNPAEAVAGSESAGLRITAQQSPSFTFSDHPSKPADSMSVSFRDETNGAADVGLQLPEPADPAPLVIPGMKTARKPVTQISSSRELKAEFSDEPFFDDPATVAAADVVDESAFESGQPKSRGGVSLHRLFSGRTWFLLAGIVLVIALLFFPERRLTSNRR